MFTGTVANYPQPFEYAEVYSLGRTISFLLEERTEEHVKDDLFGKGNGSAPDYWRTIVDSCTVEYPTERISLDSLVDFWEHEVKVYRCEDSDEEMDEESGDEDRSSEDRSSEDAEEEEAVE